jgi:polar amino acid transport system substrate-binding protein
MRLATSIVVTGVIATVLAAGVAASGDAASALAKVKARGKVALVCFPHQDNPFVHVNLAAGPMKKVGTSADFEGIDVDLVAAFARSLGVSLEVRPISTPSYAELIPAILAGQGDLIASSFSITAERAQQVNFSDPYFEVYQVVVVRDESTIASPQDLAGTTAVVVPGASMEGKIRGLGIPPDHIRHEGFTRDVLLSVLEKRADFTVLGIDQSGITTSLLRDFPKLKVAFRLGTTEQYAVAFPKGSDLCPAFNEFLAKIKASGELAAIIERGSKAAK